MRFGRRSGLRLLGATEMGYHASGSQHRIGAADAIGSLFQRRGEIRMSDPDKKKHRVNFRKNRLPRTGLTT